MTEVERLCAVLREGGVGPGTIVGVCTRRTVDLVICSRIGSLSMSGTYAQRMAQVLPLDVLPLPYATPPIDILMYWHTARDDYPAHVCCAERSWSRASKGRG